MNKLAKLGSTGGDWSRLGNLVSTHCTVYDARATANTLHGYARLTRRGVPKNMVPLEALTSALKRVVGVMHCAAINNQAHILKIR